MFQRFFFALCFVAAAGCSSTDTPDVEDAIDLIVENRSGAQLWYFSYADCGSDAFTGVIASDEFVADGSDVGEYDLPPGCYDLYVEDENECWSDNSTDGNIEGGMAFIWTVNPGDMTCP